MALRGREPLLRPPSRSSKAATVCKYLVPEGYPEAPGPSAPIGLGDTGPARLYYANVEERDGGLWTLRSRTLAFVGTGSTLGEAESAAETGRVRRHGPRPVPARYRHAVPARAALRAHEGDPMKDLISILDVSVPDLERLMADAARLKAERAEGCCHPLLAGKSLAMIFEKPSTRTRVSFEVGMYQLAGHALHLNQEDMQLRRGEAVSDTARVLSRYVSAVMIRANRHETIEEFAAHATVPVINGLSDREHPCQLLADIFTIRERFGRTDGLVAAWVGDGNNVCNSLILAAGLTGMEVRVAAPAGVRTGPGGRGAGAGRGRADRLRVHARGGGSGRRRDLHGHLGLDGGRGRGGGAAAGVRRVPDRRRARRARVRRGGRAPLPAGPPRRRDHGRRPGRAAVGGLGRGREPAPRPEGRARALLSPFDERSFQQMLLG